MQDRKQDRREKSSTKAQIDRLERRTQRERRKYEAIKAESETLSRHFKLALLGTILAYIALITELLK